MARPIRWRAGSGSVSRRALDVGAVSTDRVADRQVTEIKRWPGSRRLLRSKDLSAEAVGELDDRFQVGETVTYTTDSRLTIGTTAVAVPLDAVDESVLSGRDVENLPASGTTHEFATTGYKTVTIQADDCPVRGDGITIDVLVDDVLRASYTAPWGTRLDPETLRIGKVRRGEPVSVELSSDGEHDVDGITVTFEHVDVGAAQATSTVEEPTSAEYVGTNDADSGAMTITHGAPDGTKSGDRMFVTWLGRSQNGAQGGDGSMVPDSAWTQVVSWDDGNGFDDRYQAHVYTKVADADDEAGTSSYSWEYTGDYNYGSLTCSTFEGGGSWTLSAPAIDSAWDYGDVSVTAPDGDFALAFAMSRQTAGSPGGSEIDLSSPAVTLVEYTSSVRRGDHEIGTADAGATVTATAEGDTTEYRYQVLVVVGVS